MERVSRLSQFANPRREGPAGERRFERDILPLRRQLAQTREHHPSGVDRRSFRIKRRKPACDHIGIHKLFHM